MDNGQRERLLAERKILTQEVKEFDRTLYHTAKNRDIARSRITEIDQQLDRDEHEDCFDFAFLRPQAD